MKIRISSLTDAGRDAISQHVKESKSLKSRLIANRFFTQTVLNEDPYILLLEVKKPYSVLMRFNDLKARIEEALQDNGAKEKDYLIIEV